MDNEAPNYASWIPEAGGYVANGKVVSKSPIYDEAGKLKLDVDTTVFGNTQSTTSKNQPQVANQPITNNGITTANTTGSGTDANAQATGIGSLNSMSQNTQNAVDSALSSPAMRSPSAGEPILTVEQQDLKEIQDAHARNDIQGEINGYVKLGRDTGVDYTQTINELTIQRQQKIQTTDDNYLQQLNDVKQRLDTAKSVGDITGDYTAYKQALAEYGTLLDEQDKWRNAVGYEGAMRDKFQQQEEELKIDYDFTYLNSVRAFSDQLIQMIPALMNFQYDPTQDGNLLRAQALVEMRMRNNAAATGMYYSSTTQYAIAQAIGELVPVYQKMAKEEAVENFKLLQSTASFLMDLEQTQFDMWKSQIQMKWAENDEKRKAIDQAIQNANARGYYTNEEAALLGIAPGTESQAARERALDKQDQIEKELRNLEQDMTLAEFKNGLSIQLAQEEARLKERQIAVEAQYDDWVNQRNAYYRSLYDNSNTGGVKIKREIEDANGNKTTIEQTVYPDGNGGYVDSSGAAVKLSQTVGADTGDTPIGLVGISGLSDLFGTKAYNNAKEFYDDYNIGDVDLSGPNGEGNAKEILNSINDYLEPDGSNAQDVKNMVRLNFLEKAEADINNYSKIYFGKSEEDTGVGINKATSSIKNLITAMYDDNSGLTKDEATKYATAMYRTLLQSIMEYGTGEGEKNNFDFKGKANSSNNVVNIQGIFEPVLAKKTIFNQGNKAKEDAMISIINDIYNDDDYSFDLKDALVKSLSQDAVDFAKKNGGYAGLDQAKNWTLLNGMPSSARKTASPTATTDGLEATPIKDNGGYAGDRI